MAIAAVPKYLGNDFSQASPGLRFGMYLKVWGVNQRSKEVLWGTHDVTYKVRGQRREEQEVKVENKVEALSAATILNANDKEIMHSLFVRQQKAFSSSVFGQSSMVIDALSISPFATGLGNEHPLENGFSFLNPYGLPYLPGSGVKGVLRQAARELSEGVWGDSKGWTDEAITALFGLEAEDGSQEQQRGALIFWDVIPQISGERLQVEIMTPHQKHYYQDGQSPHDSGQPTPITFLTVPPGSGFTFHVQCNKELLTELAPELLDNWQELLNVVFSHAFDWLGFGAKTAVGYGSMQEDPAKAAEREEQLKQQKEAGRLSTMSPEDIAYEDNSEVLNKFREQFELAKQGAYQPGQEFDSQRNAFIESASSWDELRSRSEAADLLAETIKWGASKKGKDRLRQAVNELREIKE